jgi:hypothetical protein
MGDIAVTKAAAYAAPVAEAAGAGDGPGNGTVRIATSSTAVSNALDTNTLDDGRVVAPMAGKYVNIKNEDTVSPLEVAFSVAAVTLVYGTISAFTAGSAVAGWRLSPGETISEIVPPGMLFFNHVQPSGAVAATVAVRCSELVGGKLK